MNNPTGNIKLLLSFCRDEKKLSFDDKMKLHIACDMAHLLGEI